jgi:hypothetical protein
MDVQYYDTDCAWLVRQLDGINGNKAVRSGIRSALNRLKRMGQQKLASELKGTGKGSLMQSFVVKMKRDSLGGLVGFRRSSKYVQYVGAGNHAHLVDLGTVQRYTKSGSNRGTMPGNHFWTDTRREGEPETMSNIYKAVQRAVSRINMKQYG